MSEDSSDKQLTESSVDTAASVSAENDVPLVEGAPKKLRRRWFLFGALASVLLCAGACGAFFGINLIRAAIERPKTAQVVDTFMRAMAVQDIEQAYALFSQRAQRLTPVTQLTQLLADENGAVFRDYQRVSVDNINLRSQFNSNQDMPQGTVAEITGRIEYAGSVTRRMTAILEKEEDGWRFYGINITPQLESPPTNNPTS